MLLSLFLLGAPPAFAEEPAEQPQPITAADPTIDIEDLDIIAAPLTVDELKVEVDAWQAYVPCQLRRLRS